MGRDVNIIVASVNQRAFSETFIRSHVEHLPFAAGYAWGAYLGNVVNDKSLLPTGVARIPWLGHKWLESQWLKYIKEHNIKLVLAEYGPVGAHWLPVCQKAGIPLLVHFHGFDATRGEILSHYLLRYKAMFDYASSIFVVSKPMQKLLLSWGAPEEKLVMSHYGIDLSLFKASSLKSDTPIVLAVGRFATTKRPDLTIKAFAKVAQQVPEARLRMVGAGEMLVECKQLVQSVKLIDRVDFLGVLSPEEVALEMQKASVFVQHSMTTHDGETEGAPVAIMEAGATGLPVVSTIHAGIPEIVEHEKTGFLVPEGDVDGMSEYMVKLLLDDELNQAMGKASRERIAEHFSLERNIRILTTTIEKYL